MKRIIAAIPLVLLAACQTPVADQIQATDQLETEGHCGASGRQNLVGTPVSSFDKSTLPALSRIIYPDSAVTMDYRQERLNVYVDDSGKIERVACG